MSDTLDRLTTAYLPWARQGLAAQWAALGAKSANGRLELPISLTLEQTGAVTRSSAVTAPVLRLQGPPDITEIKPAQIIRTEPASALPPFEPNFFAAIEFVRPDLPWLFSPTVPDTQQHRCMPWITLVVLPTAAATVVPAGEKTLATLTCARIELPPLAEAWAWAHVQVTGGASGGKIADLMADSSRALSRLVCPRRLLPDTAYLACVVPTYELGRLAGLGTEITAALLAAKHLQPAWGSEAADAAVTLPMYYQWSFSTGDGGDFESLASRLIPREVPTDAGTVAIDLSRPGWGITTDTGGTLPLSGALKVLDREPPAWTQSSNLTAELTTILNKPNTVADGLIGPPLYGQAYPRVDSLDPATIGRQAPTWLSELNLHVEHRIAAGLGALTVRIEQDAMMAAAWDQLADFDRANQAARRQQLAAEVGFALDQRPVAAAAGIAAPLTIRATLPPLRARLAQKPLARGRAAGATAGPTAAHRARAAAATLAAYPAARVASASAPRALIATAATAPPNTELSTFTPQFTTPAGELLKDFFPTFLFPGFSSLPADSVTGLAPNAAFIEAYLAGLNHEFGREMLWRGFPADPRGTAFRSFWPPLQSADIAPIAEWADASALGSHAPSGGGGPKLTIVLVKGALLQRYPHAAIYVQKARWNAGERELDTQTKPPLFQMDHAPDVTLIAFDLPSDAFAGAAASPGDAGWFFVLQEQPDEHRFGLDAMPEGYSGPYGGLPATKTWADLSWTHTAATEAALAEMRYLTLDAWASVTPQPPSLPLSAGTGAPLATWGQSSADIAAITRQPPFRYAVHGSEWFPPLTA